MKTPTCIWDGRAELGEGIIWHPEESAIYWLDITKSLLYRRQISPNQQNETKHWSIANHISSIAACKSGGLLATVKNGLIKITLNPLRIEPVMDIESDLPDNRFNDGGLDTLGNYWFGSMDDKQTDFTAAFYRYSSDNTLIKMGQMGHFRVSNGPTFSADGQWVYFTESSTRQVFKASLLEDGSLGPQQLFVQFSEEDGYPDGMCVDKRGGVWICHWGGARVSRYTENGQLDYHIKLPVPNVTKCCFGGSDLKTLFITTASLTLSEQTLTEFPLSGGVFAVEVEQQGFLTPFFNG